VFKAFTGENAATVRDVNATAATKEVQTEKTAYELARSVMVDMKQLREDHERAMQDLDNERDARKRLEKRVETLELEAKEKDSKILALEIENADLRRLIGSKRGLASR
jgi:hypothetical protein